MKSLLLYSGLLFAVMTLPNAAIAQSANAISASGEEVETVIVTASRTKTPKNALPNTIEIIDSKTIATQAQIGGSLVDSVANIIPSFSPTRQKLSGFGETLRGRSPLYLVDNIPQSSPLRDDSRDGFTIDSFFVNRVEVIFGSNAIQGIGGTGGVVNYVTVPSPKTDNWSGQYLIQASADDDIAGDSLGYKFGALAGKKFDNFDALIGATFERRGIFYDGNNRRIALDAAQGDIMSSDSYSVFGKFGYSIDNEKRIELMLNKYNLGGHGEYNPIAGSRALGLAATSVRGDIQGLAPKNDVETLALSYSDSDLWGGNLNVQLQYNDYSGVFGGGVDATFQDPRIVAGPLFDQSANNSTKKGARIAFEKRANFIDGLRTLVGIDYIQDETFQELLETNRNWVPLTTFTSTAPYIQFNQALFDKKLNLSLGVRYEDAQISVDDYETLYVYGARQVKGGSPRFEQTLSNIGATFEIIDGITAYSSFAQGFTMADVGRVLRSITQTGLDVDTFLDVSPVVSDNSEIGIDLNKGPIKASVAYFTSKSDKGATLSLVGEVFVVRRQKTEISGLEANFTWKTPIDGLVFNIGATEIRGQTDTNGDNIIDSDLDGLNISPNRVNTSVSYTNGPFSARLQNQAFIKRDFFGIGYDPRNNFEGYSLMDLFLAYETQIGTFALSASNLFDTDYITYNSDTRLPTNSLTYFAGRGRALTLSLSKKF